MDTQKTAIYVVDDDRAVRGLVVELLRTAGLTATPFASAAEFLDYELPDVPSCLLLDNRMPGMGGLELQKVLRARSLPISIVFISGHGDIPTTVRAMKEGADDFLAKPFSAQDLIDSVHTALGHAATLRDELKAAGRVRARIADLTPRERDVFAHVVGGAPNKEIAAALGVTEKTVKVHRGQVMRKMRAGSLAELVRMAASVGVEGPDDRQLLPD